eukprot:gene21779-22747_t
MPGSSAWRTGGASGQILPLGDYAGAEYALESVPAHLRGSTNAPDHLPDAEVASKTIAEKGLLIVHTGPGKGKSTAAFGLIMRALGHDWH